jgi:glycosyltransferase involved in cell wall biosynthesis
LVRPIRPWKDAVSLVRLLRIVWKEHPRIIHTHMAKAGALGRLAGLLYNRIGPGRRPGWRAVLVHTFHGHVLDGYFSPQLSRFFAMIERRLARRTDCLIAVSRTIRDELLAKGIGAPVQWHVIPLGLDLTRFAQVPLRDGAAPLRVGLVARLVPIKNPVLFLHALHQLSARGTVPAMRAVVVGDGPLRSALERHVQQLGLNCIVQFMGWQRDLRAVYRELDVVCLTSDNEGTPLALIEAMAAGRPVIGTAVGGVCDLLQEAGQGPIDIAPGRFLITSRGLLVRPGDAEAFAAALGHLARDASLRRRLGEAAQAYAASRFSYLRLLNDMSNFYHALHELRSQSRGD